jgi:HK97 family phage prohead protease
MPYWIAAPGQTADCATWATVKEVAGDLEVIGCHQLKQEAIAQAVAIALSEGDESLFMGEYGKRNLDGETIVVSDIDDTLIADGQLVERVYAFVEEVEGDLFLVTGRPESQREETVAELESLGIEYDALVMNDASTAGSTEFKKSAVEKLLETYNVVLAVENNPDAREAYKSLGVKTLDPADIESAPVADVEDEPMEEANRFNLIANSLVQKLFGEVRGKQREIRTPDINFEMRAVDSSGMKFSGYAAVFNSASRDLGGFVEFIKPGAFARSLASRNKIMLLWNHDTSMPLASTRNGSLTLREDERGLFVEATLPDTTLGRDIAAQVRSGLTDSMSFGFQVKRDSWNSTGDQRTLEDVALFEVSLVTSEAYAATAGTVSVRNYVATADKTEIDVDVLAEAMNDFEQGNELSAEKAGVIQAVLEKLTTPSDEEKPSPDLLAIKRKQFELLLKELNLG